MHSRAAKKCFSFFRLCIGFANLNNGTFLWSFGFSSNEIQFIIFFCWLLLQYVFHCYSYEIRLSPTKKLICLKLTVREFGYHRLRMHKWQTGPLKRFMHSIFMAIKRRRKKVCADTLYLVVLFSFLSFLNGYAKSAPIKATIRLTLWCTIISISTAIWRREKEREYRLASAQSHYYLFIGRIIHYKHHTGLLVIIFFLFIAVFLLPSSLKNYDDNYVVSSHNRLCKQSLRACKRTKYFLLQPHAFHTLKMRKFVKDSKNFYGFIFIPFDLYELIDPIIMYNFNCGSFIYS